MYNLLMSGDPQAFVSGEWSLEKHRLGEHTDDDILKRFRPFDEAALARLRSLPTLFWHELSNEKSAHIGWIDEVRGVGKNLVIRFSFDPFLPEIPFSLAMELAADLDIRIGGRQVEGYRTHWAIKNVDLLDLLDRRKIIDRKSVSPRSPYAARQTEDRPSIMVRPQFFEIPRDLVDPLLVSVMMPFTPALDGVYAAITDAAHSAGMTTQRADNVWSHSVLMQDIFGLIYRSHVVVCDFSGKNPNVFYEAGIAHMLGRHVVPITQSADDVPFDLKAHRYITYLNNGEGRSSLTAQLAARLQTLKAQ